MEAQAINPQIINAKQFNTVAEYKAATNLTHIEGEWMDLARHLGVAINPKGGRRSIYDAWRAQNEKNGGSVDAPKKSVATKVAVVQTATTVQVPVTQPEPEVTAVDNTPVVIIKDTPKSKAPRRMDYQSEEEFDVALTEWVIANPKQVVTVPASAVAANAEPLVSEPVATKPVIDISIASPVMSSEPADNIEETARQIAKLMAGLKPNVQGQPIDMTQIARTIQDIVFEETQDIQNDLKTLDMQLSTALVELQKQIQSGVQTIEVKVNDAEAVKVDGVVHERFEDILRHVAVRDNVMLVGPAGSGKTTVCENVAQALTLDFYCKSVCSQTSKAELLGYMDANGNFVSTEFRVAYQNGGVFVLDEIDAGNPNVIAVLNSALANNYCAFADGMIRKHEDFVLIACANTFGTGASREYVGRNQLDSATLDRFSVIEFGYDEKLELALSPDKEFCRFVQTVRKELAGERVVISPRASIQGGKLLAAGCMPLYVLQTRIIKGMAPALADRVRATFARFYQ